MLMSKLPVMVFIAAILVASVVVLTVPAANALITRDYTYLNDNHLTARYGETAVCGDHMCAPGEWDKLQASLTAAQLGQQAGRTTPTTPTTPTTTMQTGVTPKVCETVKSMLTDAGTSPAVISQVMADLGCS